MNSLVKKFFLLAFQTHIIKVTPWIFYELKMYLKTKGNIKKALYRSTPPSAKADAFRQNQWPFHEFLWLRYFFLLFVAFCPSYSIIKIDTVCSRDWLMDCYVRDASSEVKAWTKRSNVGT